MAKQKATKVTPEVEKTYHIVNPKGAVHEVTREIAKERLQKIGYRMATKAEVKALAEMNGRQFIGQVAARPHAFDPDEALDLEELAAKAEEEAEETEETEGAE